MTDTICSNASFLSSASCSASSIGVSFSISFVAANRTGRSASFASFSIICATAWIQRCTAPTGSLSPLLSGQKSILPGGSWYLATCMAWLTSSSIPSFFAAEIGTTGIPSICSSSFTRIVPPFARTSSIIFSASTIGIPSSMSCIVRHRFRSKFDASTILIMPLGLPSIRNSRVTISSLEYGESEYIPGRSVTVASG